MKKRQIKKCVAEILDSLCDMGGFDDWYFNLGEDIQEEIERDLFDIVNRRINEDGKDEQD